MEAATARLRGAPAEPATQRTLDRLRSDRKLAERFRDGDEAAFAVLYERHRARVFAICLGVLGSREDAQDALQEVFASVAASLRRQPPLELRPWIARVARNAAIDAARTRRPASNGDEDAMDARAADGTVQTVERRDDIRDLLIGLRDLPEQQRTALVMRELGGDSYSDIGAALGVDETAVRGLIARARLSLRARIAAQAMACEVVRQRLAAETDGRRRPSGIRRHLRECETCREFSSALKSDARTLRGLAPTGVGFGLLALIAAWRGPKAVVAGGLIVKGALSSGAAQVAVVCVAALCAAGGAEQLVEKQRNRAEHSASAAAADSALASSTEDASAPQGAGRLLAGGGAALPLVSRALRQAGVTPRTGADRTTGTTTPAQKRTTAGDDRTAARDRTAGGVDTRPEGRDGRNGGGGDDVQRFGGDGRGGGGDGNRGYGGDGRRGDGNGGNGGSGRREQPRTERTGGGDGGDRSGSGGGGGDRQWGQSGRGGRDGGGNRTPSFDGGGGGGLPAAPVPEAVVPQVTAPAPVQAPAPETVVDGS